MGDTTSDRIGSQLVQKPGPPASRANHTVVAFPGPKVLTTFLHLSTDSRTPRPELSPTILPQQLPFGFNYITYLSLTLLISNTSMASTNRGGRPKNAWTSTRLRKLIRLHELSNTKVELIPEILMREDGFRPW